MTTKNENSINCNSSQNETKGRQNSDRNTVKKIPKMDLNKSDLLKLLSYLEGELQARDIVIATLKCEKVQCMLRNRGSDRVVKDPLAALQRDCFATFETNNDSLSYQQLGSLENLVLQQRRTHLRIANVLKDNQVMHRKILDLERLKKQQLQYEYKKLHNTFEEERLKHKQIVFFLLAERKKIVMKYIEERKRSEDLGQILSEEKSKIDSMAEGLEEESKKSLQMEAELEKQLALFDTESKKMMAALSSEEKKTCALEAELAKCRNEIISLEKELSEALHNNLMELSSKSSGVRVMSSPSDPITSSVAKVVQPTATASSVRVSGPMTGIARSVNPGQSLRCLKPVSGKTNDIQVDKLQDDEDCSTPLDTIKKHPISFGRSIQSESGSTSTVKKSLFGIQRNMSVPNTAESNIPGLIKKQITTVGRGTPPPVPPNKPIIPPKKDLISFIKKTSVADNTASTAEKDQKDSQLRHNNLLPNEIVSVDKPDEMVKN
ncbi:CTTNBP2 N-terminal-like protein [Rhopalosiphum padi]|uniref:CTTNBP2 N-terminal-like protein n=1 Tax=Rhopalosiphum padi TaxID=40932 RepID=UPI00298DD22D|nr:CTTNBP2 N-terminal-like protein [Rhopalosiphum padi]XP_060844506.1 CTTNBP2 N-terminal-like protein [Rhopalosiphum padi]XP_060844507.1 CTTNBP2 N-terminal-like protein [Rhopalosiphum padi]